MIPFIYLICPITRCSAYLIMDLESKTKHRQSNVLCKSRCHFFNRAYSDCSSRISSSFTLCNHYIRKVQLYTLWRNSVHFTLPLTTGAFSAIRWCFFAYQWSNGYSTIKRLPMRLIWILPRGFCAHRLGIYHAIIICVQS